MASTVLRAVSQLGKNKHTVGSLNNWRKELLNMGALCVEDIDNYMIVELGFDNEGNRTCKLLSDITKKGRLICSVEEYLGMYENITAFFNGEGERARIAIQEEGHRFECSNVIGLDANAPIKNGMNVYFDPTKKAYVVCNGKDAGAFETAGNKYVVVDCVGNTLGGLQTIRLEIL